MIQNDAGVVNGETVNSSPHKPHETAHQSAVDFYKQFQFSKQSILKAIENIGTTDQKLKCLQEISDLSQKCRQARTFLPQYDLELYASELRKFNELIESKNIIRKFSFAKRTAGRGQTDTPKRDEIKLLPELPLTATDCAHSSSSELAGSTHKLVTSSEVTSSTLKISNFTDSVILLDQALSSCSIDNINHCIVYIPNIKGSFYITRATNCIFVAHCHQFRLHESTNCQFFLSCTSKRPIIEKSNGLKFGQFPSLGSNRTDLVKWEDIDDFNWLRRGQSENWTVVDESIGDSNQWTALSSGTPNYETLMTLLDGHIQQS